MKRDKISVETNIQKLWAQVFNFPIIAMGSKQIPHSGFSSSFSDAILVQYITQWYELQRRQQLQNFKPRPPNQERKGADGQNTLWEKERRAPKAWMASGLSLAAESVEVLAMAALLCVAKIFEIKVEYFLILFLLQFFFSFCFLGWRF